MNKLIPLNKRSVEDARAIQVKGGLVKSEAKSTANMTKNLRHGKYAKKFTLKVKELAKNPDNSALKIFTLIESIGEDWDNLNPKLKMDLARLYCEAHKTIHGTKQVNLNVNAEVKKDLEKWFNESNK